MRMRIKNVVNFPTCIHIIWIEGITSYIKKVIHVVFSVEMINVT